MAGRIRREDVDAVRERTRIDEVVGEQVVLKSAGVGSLKGLCPFHDEKTPSFQVTPARGLFYCFGCGAGGDVITFIRRIENLDYIEAVKFLAQRAGLQVPEQGVDDSMSRLRQRVLEINRETARFFAASLLKPEGKPGLDYFTRRRLPMPIIRRFGLGWAPESRFALVNHLRAKGYSESEMIQANVAVQTRSGRAMDRFHARASQTAPAFPFCNRRLQRLHPQPVRRDSAAVPHRVCRDTGRLPQAPHR